MNRRSALELTALGLTGAATAHQLWPRPRLQRRPGRSKVAILPCKSYENCDRVVREGLQLIAPEVKGKRVLLKPNLVEYSSRAAINTHPAIIAAAAESLFRMGAAEVVVGDGPGHVRDTELLIEECGLKRSLSELGCVRFVDLNFDAVHRVKMLGGFTALKEIWLPETVLAAEVTISMPKIKTHHWAGVTLSLKNLFGCVPGNIYGWPKNILHWEGITNSIVDLTATIPIHYVIADGIVAMEGNGPLHGQSRDLGCLVFANDPIAADATCCRLMKIDPTRVGHLRLASSLGNLHKIEQMAEPISSLSQRFVSR